MAKRTGVKKQHDIMTIFALYKLRLSQVAVAHAYGQIVNWDK